MEDQIKGERLERITHEINLERLQSRLKSKSFSIQDFERKSSYVAPNISDFERPKRLPEYFAIDIDNTFYHRDPQVFRKNIEAFRKVRNSGYNPFLCTARPFQTLPYIFGHTFFERTGYKGYPGIYLNGCVVYDKKGNLINVTTFEKQFLDEILEHIEKNKLEDSFLFWDVNGHYALKPLNEYVGFLLKGDNIPGPTIKTREEIAKLEVISIITSTPKFDLKNSEVGKEYSVRNVGLKYLIEYFPMGITKADGIALLMKHVNLDPESCGFIGDGDNDVESMELCDISFAVANATNYVKRHAKWILHLNYHDGAFSYAMNLLYNINNY